MNRWQRLALTAALAAAVTATAWTFLPFSVGTMDCWAVSGAVAGDLRPQPSTGRGVSLRSLRDPEPSPTEPPCRQPARYRLLSGAVVVLAAGAFALGSRRLLATPPPG